MTTIEEVSHKIDDLRRDMDVRFDALPNVYATKEALTEVEKETKTKISFPWFVGTLLTILGLQATIFYFMFSKIEQIDQNTQDTKQSVSNIEGKLEPFDFIIQK